MEKAIKLLTYKLEYKQEMVTNQTDEVVKKHLEQEIKTIQSCIDTLKRKWS